MYLPRGTWIDFFTGRRVRGGATVRRRSGPTTFPLYVHAGSAIAFGLRTPELWRARWRTNDLQRGDRQGWLVAPALGLSTSARDRATTLAVATDRCGATVIRLSRPLREQQFLVLAPARVCRARLGGSLLTRVTTSALRGRASGWAAVPGRPHELVVKTTAAGDRALTLTPCG